MSLNRLLLKAARGCPSLLRFYSPNLRAVAIEPTNACNLQCQMCYSQLPALFPARKSGLMDWELYKKVVDELATIRTVSGIGLNFGGESLLHKHFAEMILYAAKTSRFGIGFNTNGNLLTEALSKMLVDRGVDSVSISLDGLKSWHESIRKGSNYDLVERNIRTLKRVRGQNLKPRILVNLTQTSQSKKDIKGFVRYWLGVADNVHLYPCLTEDLKVSEANRFFGRRIIRKKRCTWPIDYLAILWNGDVTTCCHDISGVTVMGNAMQNTIRSIWTSERYKKLRYAAYRNRFEPNTLCSGCTAWKISLADTVRHHGGVRVVHSGLCRSYEHCNT